MKEDLFTLFSAEVYGPYPGEVLTDEELEGQLIILELDAQDVSVRKQFRHWWAFCGGLFRQTA